MWYDGHLPEFHGGPEGPCYEGRTERARGLLGSVECLQAFTVELGEREPVQRLISRGDRGTRPAHERETRAMVGQAERVAELVGNDVPQDPHVARLTRLLGPDHDKIAG